MKNKSGSREKEKWEIGVRFGEIQIREDIINKRRVKQDDREWDKANERAKSFFFHISYLF